MILHDRWALLILFAGFSALLVLAAVLIAQLETYVPGRGDAAGLRAPEEPEFEDGLMERREEAPDAA